jgi:hypothetical protein
MSERPDQPTALQRALMERAQSNLARDREKPPRRILVRIVGACLAIGLVLVVMTGFSKFLTSVQKVLEVVGQDEVPAVGEPLPVFVVPDEVPNTVQPAQPSDMERLPAHGVESSAAPVTPDP